MMLFDGADGVVDETPITEVVDSVIKGKVAAREAVSLLMERAPAKEGEFGE